METIGLFIIVVFFFIKDLRSQFKIKYYEYKLKNMDIEDSVKDMAWYKVFKG